MCLCDCETERHTHCCRIFCLDFFINNCRATKRATKSTCQPQFVWQPLIQPPSYQSKQFS